MPRELFVAEFARREGLAAVCVLEIGTGTGYNAALLSSIVGKRGRVVSVELDRSTGAAARAALRTGGYRVRVVTADGHDGFPRDAPYDRVIVTASTNLVPRSWWEQLADDGLLIVPLRLDSTGTQAIPVLARTARGFRSVTVLAGGFMPLRTEGDEGLRPFAPSLGAHYSDGATGEGIGGLTGECLRRLSPAARRRLPRDRVVAATPGFGTGAITRDGRSLALVAPPFERPRPTVSSLRAFGDDRSAELLLAAVDAWDRRGRPAPEDIRISVAFAGDGGRVTHRWPPLA